MGLRAGDTILDVGCGSGASLLPAAEAVGGSGRVVGVDFAEKLLELGRAKAAARGLGNVEFLAAALATLDLGDAGAPPPDIAHVRQVLPVGAEEFWAMALGSGYRIPLDVMGPDAAERVRSAFFDCIAREWVTEVACDLMVARATKA